MTVKAKTNVGIWINVLNVWHALLALLAVGGVFLIWAGGSVEWSTMIKAVVTFFLLFTAIAGSTVVLFLMRGDHKARIISLGINYLWLLISLFGAMHVLGIFTGIDSLADTFGKGIPFLGLMFVGYLITTIADHYEGNPARQKMFVQAGKIVAAVFGIVFLFAINTIGGIIALFPRYNSPAPFILTAGIILFGLMLWAMWRTPMAEFLGANNAHSEMISGYLFLSPNLLGFLFFFAGPLLFSLYVSFTDWDAFGTKNWVGFDNYSKILSVTAAPLQSETQRAGEVIDAKRYDELARVKLLGKSYVVGAQDKLFWISLRNTFIFGLMAVPLSIIPALILSVLLNSKLPGMKIYRAVYFLPSIAAVVGVALIWQWLFNATIGYINYGILGSINFINQIFHTQMVDPQIKWVSDSSTALMAVAVMSAWQWTGFNTVLFLAGLQNIPKDLYEAATVDGANVWRQFWSITLPMLAPTTFFVVTTSVINSMQVFEQVFILINPPAGPNNSTLTLVLYLYQNGFQRFKQGYASAIAWVLFLVIFGVTLFQFQRQRSSAYES